MLHIGRKKSRSGSCFSSRLARGRRKLGSEGSTSLIYSATFERCVSRPVDNAASSSRRPSRRIYPPRRSSTPQPSGSGWRYAPFEVRRVDPHPVEDDANLPRQGYDRFLPSAPLGDAHSPRAQCSRARHTGQETLGGLVQRCAQQRVPCFRNSSGPVDFARLISLRRQPNISTNRARLSKLLRNVDRDAIGGCDNRTDPQHRHQTSADGIVLSHLNEHAVQTIILLSHRSRGSRNWLDDLGNERIKRCRAWIAESTIQIRVCSSETSSPAKSDIGPSIAVKSSPYGHEPSEYHHL